MPANPLHPPMNYVFVDYESVHEVDLSLIGNKAVSFTLLLGAKQKVDGAVVEKLMKHAASVHLVRLESSGKNALDFVLAYYIGRAAVTDPTGYFHIVSKDTGFDPLIKHLLSRHIHAYRHSDFSTLKFGLPAKTAVPAQPKAAPVKKPVAKPAKPVAKPPVKPPVDLRTRFLAHLRKNPNNRPEAQGDPGQALNDLCGQGRHRWRCHGPYRQVVQGGFAQHR